MEPVGLREPVVVYCLLCRGFVAELDAGQNTPRLRLRCRRCSAEILLSGDGACLEVRVSRTPKVSAA